MKILKEKGAFILWASMKIVFLPLWVWIALWLRSKAGLAGLLPFALIMGLYQISDIWNQFLISKTGKALKEQIAKENLRGEERQRNLRWISQIRAKRNLISAACYLFNRAGTEKSPRASFQPELSDFGPLWIRKHILWTMMITESYIVPFILKGYLPPVKTAVRKIARDKGVCVGLSIGCGLARFEQAVAEWCHKEKIPVVILGLDNQSQILGQAFARMQERQEFRIRQHSGGEIDISSLAQEAKEKPIIYLVCEDAGNLGDLFAEKAIDVAWVLHSKHHLQERWRDIMASIKRISQEWVILEELRDWTLLFSQYLGCWIYSRLLLCDAENSVLAGQTKAEWEEELGEEEKLVVAKPPYEIWAMPDSLYLLLKKEGVIK